jgi:hypothetical protein
MTVQDFLTGGEKILYESPGSVKLGKLAVKMYITDVGILLYRETGLVSKKDEVTAIKHGEVEGLDYREQGTLKKKGILRINRSKDSLVIEGDPSTLKSAWQTLQQWVKTRTLKYQ